MNDDFLSNDPQGDVPQARARRYRFSVVWLVPIVAILIAGYLGWRGLTERGPLIVISFDTADGLTSGQTEVKNKSVPLGTVDSIRLSDDLHHVEVAVRMTSSAARTLTDHARFWVVRPRINGASVTGLETVMSGAYIAMDAGEPGGHYTTHFKGLESPPGVRSDQPGHTYTLITQSLGSLGQGAPIFFRDVVVGEVLGYTMPPEGRGPIKVQIFVQAPYDSYLRTTTRFWNVSGVQVGLGPGGLKVKLQSLQALLSGGVAFDPPDARNEKNTLPSTAGEDTTFLLYDSAEEANSAGYRERIPLVTYLTSSVSGLTKGGRLTMFGIQVGMIDDVKLEVDPATGKAHVRVAMELQPERVLDNQQVPPDAMTGLLRTQVADGLRASVQSTSMLTGESEIALTFVKNAKPEQITMEGDAMVLPGQAGGMAGIMDSLSVIGDKIAAMPLTQMGDNLTSLLAHADARINSPDTKQALTALRSSLQNLQVISRDARSEMPQLLTGMDKTLKNANSVLSSYGGDTDFQRNLQQMMQQLNDAARSLRFLSDFLTHHPSALITGR
ncbi:intermembrane transport protein PqiB [Komagataeibacter diospyri]|uniref:PqiB family protein n=1 Tax=Komagataeibacter diospyri TaxID=1932662 RepID=UPI00113DF21F|nr:MlaD family protein [Komagataeibacter diospyri]GCE90647.1 paraquat-inducible protein B [Komagataeibacter diospyri]